MTSHPHRIVFANEKGGTGKSTTAVHIAVALAFRGARVVAFDLDHRQRTMCRYFENRAETSQRRGVDLPTATCHVVEGMDEAAMEVDLVWSYRGPDGAPFYSGFLSDADWLPVTGNLLVDDGARDS